MITGTLVVVICCIAAVIFMAGFAAGLLVDWQFGKVDREADAGFEDQESNPVK